MHMLMDKIIYLNRAEESTSWTSVFKSSNSAYNQCNSYGADKMIVLIMSHIESDGLDGKCSDQASLDSTRSPDTREVPS